MHKTIKTHTQSHCILCTTHLHRSRVWIPARAKFCAPKSTQLLWVHWPYTIGGKRTGHHALICRGYEKWGRQHVRLTAASSISSTIARNWTPNLCNDTLHSHPLSYLLANIHLVGFKFLFSVLQRSLGVVVMTWATKSLFMRAFIWPIAKKV